MTVLTAVDGGEQLSQLDRVIVDGHLYGTCAYFTARLAAGDVEAIATTFADDLRGGSDPRLLASILEIALGAFRPREDYRDDASLDELRATIAYDRLRLRVYEELERAVTELVGQGQA